VVLSVPTVIGCGGVREQVELPLTPKERMGLTNSARVLREIIDQVEARLAGQKPASESPAQKPTPTTPATPTVTTASNGKAIPRSAWQAKK
jgi:hypothetical protein